MLLSPVILSLSVSHLLAQLHMCVVSASGKLERILRHKPRKLYNLQQNKRNSFKFSASSQFNVPNNCNLMLMASQIAAKRIQKKMSIILSQILGWVSTHISGHPAHVIWQTLSLFGWCYLANPSRKRDWKSSFTKKLDSGKQAMSQILGWISTDVVSSKLAEALFQLSLSHNFQHLLCTSHNSTEMVWQFCSVCSSQILAKSIYLEWNGT